MHDTAEIMKEVSMREMENYCMKNKDKDN